MLGMSEGQIPWSAVNDYAYRYRVNATDFEDLWKVVRSLDGVYTEARAAKAKIDNNRLGKKPPIRGR